MMNMDKLISYALHNNKNITDHIAKTPEGYPLIQVNRSPNANFPLIEFHQISGQDINYADEEPFIVRSTYQITYYGTPEGYYKIAESLESTIRDIGFKIMNKYSFKNITTNIDHFVIHGTAMMEHIYYDTLLEIETEKYNETYPPGSTKTIPEGIYFDEVTGEEVRYLYSDEINPNDLLELEEN